MSRKPSGAFLATLAGGVALWALDPVAVPLAYASFALGAFAPMRRVLDERLPTSVAVFVCLITMLAVFAALGTAIGWSFSPVFENFERYEQALRGWQAQAQTWAQSVGISLSSEGSSLGKKLADGLSQFVSGFVLMIGFFALAGAEVIPYEQALHRALNRRAARRVRRALHNCGKDVRLYLFIRTVVGLITGSLVVGFAYLIGLELPWTWGSLNFLLNYIPTLGSVLGVVPPVLFAQASGGWEHALWALVAVGGAQLIMGVVVDPLMQGRQLSISPLAVLVSVAFWGLVWGIPGAFIATPMTMLVVRLCQPFERSRWAYEMIVRADREGTEADED